MANILPKEKRVAIISALTEGNSIRSIERMTGVHRDSIMRFGARIGHGCEKVLDAKMRNLECERIEADEIWAFIGKKQKNTTISDRIDGLGDAWTYLSIDPVSKLMPTFHVGQRGSEDANIFMRDLADRMANHIQLSTDSMNAYADAVENAFGGEVDYAQVIKTYESDNKQEQRRYSPAKIVKVRKEPMRGAPDMDKACTSYIERANLTFRLHCKRLARLTLGFSKKPENFKAAVTLHLASYNFVKSTRASVARQRCRQGLKTAHGASRIYLMPHSDYKEMVKAIRALHGCAASHVESVPVTEVFKGQVA